jgi:ABC-type Fe3+ transport system substrate-binding protein
MESNKESGSSIPGRTAGVSRRSLLKVAGVGSIAAGLPFLSMAKAMGGAYGQEEEPGGGWGQGTPVPLETRSLAELYAAALAEGGNLDVVEGGDSINQEYSVEAAFLAQFPKIKLNVTTDLSKYNDARIDLAFAKGTTPPDVAHLQTLQDFTRWKKEGRLLNYKPLGWERVYPQFKDPDGAWTALTILVFTNVVNTSLIPAAEAPRNFLDYLDPKYKDSLVFLYPNDDDAALFLFYEAIQRHGWSFMDDLMKNSPLFVRGAARVVVTVASGQKAATFTGLASPIAIPGFPVQQFLPTDDRFIAWGQRAAIFKDAAHPNAAKLWTSWHLQASTQAVLGYWPVREDLAPPDGFQPIVSYSNAGLAEFPRFMQDRADAERFRYEIREYVGDPVGPDPATTFSF